jgi:hypothetical protein
VKTLLRIGVPLLAVAVIGEYNAYRDRLRLAATAPEAVAAHALMELYQSLAAHYGRKAITAELRYRELTA